jgi:hypothetical protein
MRISIIIFMSILFPILTFGQNESEIDELRKIVKLINLDSTLIIREKPTEFGKLTWYYKGEKLVKVTESNNLECCERIDQYYYYELKFIFLESNHMINFARNRRDSCNKLIQNPGRNYYYYFKDERMIYGSDMGHETCLNNKNDYSIGNILTLSKKYLKQFTIDR